MKWLQGAYTQRFNGRHEVFGHLFQGRYKAVVVDGSAPGYFEVVSTYIHLNPARAGLIRIGEEPLKRYRWSSYAGYVSRAGQRPPWLHRERVLAGLGLKAEESKRYERIWKAGFWNWVARRGARHSRRNGRRCGGAGMWGRLAFLRN